MEPTKAQQEANNDELKDESAGAIEQSNTPSDELDLDAILAGDKRAFEQLVIQESPRLFRVIVRILSDDDEAQSILQETFLQAYQRIHTFRRESKLTTWLYAIGINLARATLRKSRRLSSLEDQDVERLQPSFSRGMFVDSPVEWINSLESLTKDEKELILWKNLERLLGI